MKALILSAGFGTRLRPYTEKIPKPLFPIGGRPLIDIIIGRLIESGATTICVNTHHLNERIEAFLKERRYPVPVIVRYEPEILGTGGAMNYFSDILSDGPFVVINSDLLTDIEIRRVYDEHIAQGCPATLVLHDHQQFNTVTVDSSGNITGFPGSDGKGCNLLAFTGIQVVDPLIFRYIPSGRYVNSIDTYDKMIQDGKKIRGHIVEGHYWNDLGTPERYRQTVLDCLVGEAFSKAAGRHWSGRYETSLLAGDGSDRKWFRITSGKKSVILADHGISVDDHTCECDAYVAVGRHLHELGIHVPEIYTHDRFSGLVFAEDLGDMLFQEAVLARKDKEKIRDMYRVVIDQLIRMSLGGAEGFDPSWAYQGSAYDRDLIIEKEAMYFTESFLKGYLELGDFSDDKLASEFSYLCDLIMENSIIGLMHRDLQSRNIMVGKAGFYFIDFQGARFGPLQYDLASLLLDPYVDLDGNLRDGLASYAADRIQSIIPLDRQSFFIGYRYSGISRLMQALGAFGFLTRVKKKQQFKPYIPIAIRILNEHLASLNDPCLASLGQVVASAARLTSNPQKN